ncbi:MAG: Crp/Fnr family transcriptional regulator [Cyanobacteria bacterium J06642_12]
MNLSSYFSQDSLPATLREATFTRTFEPNEILFRQGERAAAFYIVESGRVKAVRYTTDGSDVTLQVAREGESVATEAVFIERYSCTGVAEVKTTVTVYPKERLLAIVRNNPLLLMLFAKQLSELVFGLKNNLELRGTRSARSRILRYLALVSEPSTKGVHIDRPLKDIANELGLAPEVLYRTLSKLEKDGQIHRDKRFIQLL